MFLIDNNISPKLAARLSAYFPNMVHVVDFGLDDVNDYIVWSFAKTNNYTILTKDTDFVNILMLRGFPPKVIRLNCGNVTTREIEAIMIREQTVIHGFVASPTHGLLVIN